MVSNKELGFNTTFWVKVLEYFGGSNKQQGVGLQHNFLGKGVECFGGKQQGVGLQHDFLGKGAEYFGGKQQGVRL